MSIPPASGGFPPSSDQPAGSWPPYPGAPYGGGPDEIANDSGQNAGVPPQVAVFKWNWGAFELNWIWCFNHGMIGMGILMLVLDLLAIIPFVGLIPFGIAIYLGLNGHKLAWQNRRFEGGFAQYMAVQSAWSVWGIVVFCLGFIMIPIYAAILFPVFAKAREKAREQSLQHGAQLVTPRPDSSGKGRSYRSAHLLRESGGRVVRIWAEQSA